MKILQIPPQLLDQVISILEAVNDEKDLSVMILVAKYGMPPMTISTFDSESMRQLLEFMLAHYDETDTEIETNRTVN